ncbi:MobF family relaxase [Agromyces sp. Marseille-Q5079]|uniref:MobF family relaxase n=1 Tax=Agromyces sp. Marseille-Q5079 TaxID=3439059 RepID=UPI003D9CAD47
MRVMSAGQGYRYLLRTVAAADGERSLSTPLTRYYEVKGTPPGRWMGSGVGGLAGGAVAAGDTVTEEHLQLLIGQGVDPVTRDPLGRAFPQYDGGRRAVAGFDITFSMPKSASVLWGISDAATQAIILRAHHQAVERVVDYMEREVAATRTGVAAADGAVAQVAVTGLIATAFDHFDSRAGDPHLHTHVVVSNKVQTTLDGKWRSLDGRPLHESVVAMSELHEALLADALTRELGIGWERRERGRDRNPVWAIASVPESLVQEFSTRSRHIGAAADRLIAEYTAAHGHRPGRATIVRIRAQATLATRPEKHVRSLAELASDWRARATAVLGQDATSWARRASASTAPHTVNAADVPHETIATLGVQVMHAVSEKRATWRHWNLTAEAARQTMHYRFATQSDREAVVAFVVDAAEHASLQLTPTELALSPATFQREDGTSVFQPKHSTVFTSHELLDAEVRLRARAADAAGPTTSFAALHAVDERRARGEQTLADDQLAALASISSSGRTLDLLVGPAGAGKTTAMAALRRAWEIEHGPGSVVGLAPSAAAAHVLAGDLGIQTENLAKWWQNHVTSGTAFRNGQLVIVDEASLAGTLALDRVTALAAAVGAKVLLVGDHAQLQSVEAGGAFAMLARDRTDAAELVDIHRFVHDWEKAASLGLRRGDETSIETYLAHDRVQDGDSEAMADAAYLAWRADTRAGRMSVLVSDSHEAVAALNERARTDSIVDGRVDATRELALHDGTRVSVGDTIITRRNDRRLHAGRAWVRNGDRWTVLAVHRSGALEVRLSGSRRGSSARLPAAYVRHHVELGYAVTAHRAQGLTTDTAHVVVARGMTRENLYVAMTRGRQANTAYVALDRPDAAHTGIRPRDDADATAHSVLVGVLRHVGAELSAHEALAREQERVGSIAQLAAEYETIAAAAQHSRWTALVRNIGLSDVQTDAVIASDAFGPLCAELRRVEAHGMDVARVAAAAVRSRGFEDAVDVAAVLRARVARARDAAPRGRSRFIGGLIPVADGPMDAESTTALRERAELIEARAAALAERAIDSRAAWLRQLGAPPPFEATSSRWRRQVSVVAAYRDRYGITDGRPLGAERPASDVQKADAARARAAMEAARRVVDEANPTAAARVPNVNLGVPNVGGRV